MSTHGDDRRGDPVNPDARDWEEAGLPAQEDATEDQPLPDPDREQPTQMDEVGSTGTEREAGEPLDQALARGEPDAPGAVGAAAPDGPAETLLDGEDLPGERSVGGTPRTADDPAAAPEENALREEDG